MKHHGHNAQHREMNEEEQEAEEVHPLRVSTFVLGDLTVHVVPAVPSTFCNLLGFPCVAGSAQYLR